MTGAVVIAPYGDGVDQPAPETSHGSVDEMPKPTPGQFPSQTFAARVKRKRPLVSLSLAQDVLDELDAMAEAEGESRSGMVAKMIRERSKPRKKKG